mmetsp:Transcript_16791/g.29462  ORF Transcript_16791/g.29462 Transcript_16791/m.29462 type:complete len:312 (+) Transcript_16791:47-982(+)
MRPTSGASIRSRRDEVWELKRQRFVERQRGGGGAANNGHRPQPLSDLQTVAAVHSAPKSPLSKLVAEGYPLGGQASVSAHQPYGERPLSGAGLGGLQHKPSSRGSHGVGVANGFDANIANQWSNNVQHDVVNRQNRHDPNVSGPAIQRGGQRVTQAPGGGASIDLSWGSAGAAPQARTPQGGSNVSGQCGQGMPYSQDGQSYHPQRGMSPARGLGNGSGAPWGTDSNYTVAPRARQAQPSAAPFGTDQNVPAVPAGSVRGKPPSPFGGAAGSCAAGAMYGGAADVAPAGGQRGRGGLGGRPPGGASSFVFG